MQDTEWEYSNEVAEDEFIEATEGPQYLVIMKAEYSKDSSEYTLGLKSLTNNAYISLRYWLDKRNSDTGEIEPNSLNRRVLVSLKKALYGPDAVGIPNPSDIVGCAVEADVKLQESKTKPGNIYPRIYNYKAVPTSVAEGFGNPEQYSTPDTDGGVEQGFEE